MSKTHLGLVPNTKHSEVCYNEFTHASVCSLKWVEGKGVEKTWVTFLWNHSRQCSGGRALDLQTKICCFESQQLLALFSWNHTFWTHVLLSIFETAVTRHPNHLWRWDSSKIKRLSSVEETSHKRACGRCLATIEMMLKKPCQKRGLADI